MGRLTAVLAVACVLTAVPGVAGASTVDVDPITGYAQFVGGVGPNDVTMNIHGPYLSPFSGAALWFIDGPQELSAGTGCVAGLPVWCQARHAVVRLDGGDDGYSGYSVGDITVTGGTGADDIRASGLWTSVSGGSGADRISVGSNGYEVAYGDSGDDNIRSSGSGGTSVLSGGPGHDLVYGEERKRNDLSGGAGDDYLIVRGGATVTGGIGEDVILSRPSFSRGRRLSGGDAADTIVGARGTDTVSGGRGDDVIDVSGDAEQEYEAPDTVDCGSGNDTVYADADDVLADDCENRLDGPMPTNERVQAALARLADAFDVTIAG